MTLVVLGIDALDPEIVEPGLHENLVLNTHRSIETIASSSGEPSTHELWPTIITGLRPEEHGLKLDDGVAWESSILRFGSSIADNVVPESVQSRIGAWLLNSTEQDAFRESSDYYEANDLETVFDRWKSKAIGIPNYVVNPDKADREHELRKNMGKMFERDMESKGGHKSEDPDNFYETCMEMSMVRIARTRRALRSRRYELVFGYTSGLDLIGHISYNNPKLQKRAYDEMDDFVGELRDDLDSNDELLLISDHGLQKGVHTQEAMVSGTNEKMVESIDSVTDVREALEENLENGTHISKPERTRSRSEDVGGEEVQQHLQDLGYM